MKTMMNGCPAMLSLMAAATLTSSCIFDAPGDEFYRTLWSSSQVPLGPVDVEEITLEFLCGNQVSIRNEYNTLVAHGTYAPDGNVATFSDLNTVIDDIGITFIEAHLNGETLFLLWRPNDMLYPFTTALKRKSPSKLPAYEENITTNIANPKIIIKFAPASDGSFADAESN